MKIFRASHMPPGRWGQPQAALNPSNPKAVVFGDLYLADVRAYRERQLAGTGLEPLFPLWAKPSGELTRAMIAAGQRAKIVCLGPKLLPASFAGRGFDPTFLADLPAGVDPCGEKGECHSFVYDGPMFRKPINVRVGGVCGGTVSSSPTWFPSRKAKRDNSPRMKSPPRHERG